MPFAAQLQPLLSPQNDNAPSTGGAKKKNKKKKSAAAKANAAQAAAASPTEATAPAASTDPNAQDGADHDNSDVADKQPSTESTPVKTEKTEEKNDTASDAAPSDTEATASPTEASTNGNGHTRKGSKATNGHAIPLHIKSETESSKDSDKDGSNPADRSSLERNGDDDDQSATSTTPSTPTTAASKTITNPSTMTLDGPEAEALRTDVERLRKQVEELRAVQETHKEEAEQLRNELQESEAGREEAETKYDNLLGRVGKIKETLDSRLKRDQKELEEAREHIEELEKQNSALQEAAQDAEAAVTSATASAANQIARLQRELDEIEREHEHEKTALRNQAQLSQKNVQREKEDLVRQMKQLQSELDETRTTMNDWEVIACEQRSLRESTAEKTIELEEQLSILREQHQHVLDEASTQSDAVNSLQRALQDIQDARRHELRELVQDSETKLQAAEERARIAEKAAETAKAESAELKKELERVAPFEAELKDKISSNAKLRSDIIKSHGHLTKALQFIKHMNPDDRVDKGVITNHLVLFLTLDRSDPKKFQVLQVIASILEWSDDIREKVGLARPGASASSLRLPASPFGRTPSSTSLHASAASEMSTSSTNKPSLANLFANFLMESVDNNTPSSTLSAEDSHLISTYLNTPEPPKPNHASAPPSSQSSGPSSANAQGGAPSS
ncbi:hypothetical protein SEUCBS139899_006110 [Sporothrix eucalyptigena]